MAEPGYRRGHETTVAVRLLQQLELLDGHQHRAGLRALAGADDAALLEQVHDPTGAGEADLQLALQHRRRPELAAHHQLHRLAHERLVLVVVAARLTRSMLLPPASSSSPSTPLTYTTSGAWRRQWATTLRTSSSLTNEPWMRCDDVGVARQQQHVALADQLLGARLVEDDPAVGEADDTANAMRAGMLALMTPVMTLTDGRCVATIRWMPTARAFWAMRVMLSSTSRAATIIRSLSSSTTTTMYGSRSNCGGRHRRVDHGTPRPAARRGRTPRCSR